MSLVDDFFAVPAYADDKQPAGKTRTSRLAAKLRDDARVSHSAHDVPVVSRIVMIVVAFLAVCLTSYLSFAALTSSKVAGCGGGHIFDCNHVLHSKWSTAFGIPVGVPAAALYVVSILALVATFHANSQKLKYFAYGLLSFAALSAGVAAVWFISLQVFVLEHLCQYCLAAHACGILFAAIVLWKMPLGLSRTLAIAAAAFVGVGILATGQIVAEEPKAFEIEHHALEVESDFVNDTESNGEESDVDASLFSAPGFDTPSIEAHEESDLKPVKVNNVFEAPVDATEKHVETTNQQTIKAEASGSNTLLSLLSMMSPTSLLAAPVIQQGETDTSNVSSKEKPRRLVPIHGGKIQLDARQWPLVGSPDAKHIFVEMFDYTCPHCRANHKFVKAAMEQMGDDVAVLVLSVPMSSRCNDSVTTDHAVHAEACDLAQLSVAVSRVDPSAFAEFHDWLFQGDTAPSAAAAKLKAAEMTDSEKLEQELAKQVCGQYVAKQVELYKAIGAGTVPKMLFPSATVSGKVESPDSLMQIITQSSR